jgi:hypothetical protein
VVCAAVEHLVALSVGYELKGTSTELEQFFKVCIPKLQRLHKKNITNCGSLLELSVLFLLSKLFTVQYFN